MRASRLRANALEVGNAAGARRFGFELILIYMFLGHSVRRVR